jgi:integrase
MSQRTLNRLTSIGINKLSGRGYYADGGGLYFRISEFDTRSWAFRYTKLGKAREMGLGSYPDVTLKEARESATRARQSLRESRDPINERKAARSAMLAERTSSLTFTECAKAFMEAKEHEWKNAKHGSQWRNTLNNYAYPIIGKLLTRDIEQSHILKILKPIWVDRNETASRLRGRIESVIDYAIAHGYRKEANPARWKGHLDKILAAPKKVQKVKHHAALDYRQVGQFMANLRLQDNIGSRALELAILTATRSGEVRGATWSEFDLDAAVWTIPASRMKAGKEHRIPLSDAAISLLCTLPLLKECEWVFSNNNKKPLSDMALTAILRRMNHPVTAHGFRSTFRDWAGETTAYPREVIEHALAHQLKDKAEAAYARGTLFDKRKNLMNDWAKYCAKVAPLEGASITSINAGRNAA